MNRAPHTFVVLSIDGLQLAVPRADVRAVEPAVDVVRDPSLAGAIGWIRAAGGRCRVIGFDADLRLQPETPAARRACVVLAAPAEQGGVEFVGVLCDDFTHSVPQGAPWQPLPAALSVPGSPLRGLLLLGQALACTTTAAALARWLPHGAAVAAEGAAGSNAAHAGAVVFAGAAASTVAGVAAGAAASTVAAVASGAAASTVGAIVPRPAASAAMPALSAEAP